jgi:transcriptional regulator with XRE-family HTH domain
MDALDKMLQQQMKDSGFREAWEESEEEYQLSRMVIRARLERGMTQSDLARAAGMDQRVISRVETGQTLPTMRTLSKIADGLGCGVVIKFVPKERREEALMEG